MGLRCRSSLRLFPGVRLNISGSGVSTTIGRRGASLTLGHRGTYLNLGLPGTGLSYRTKISSAAASPSPRSPPKVERTGGSASAATPRIHPTGGDADVLVAPGETAIGSRDIEHLTTRGLAELKDLINEADGHRTHLRREIAKAEKELLRARARLAWARCFIVRLALRGSIPARTAAVEAAENALDALKAELEASFVEIDFGLSREADLSYVDFTRAFERVSECAAIWDITSEKEIDRFRERSAASTAVRRTAVTFRTGRTDLIRTSAAIVEMGNVRGRSIQFYPGFVMMRDERGQFALLEYSEVDARFRRCNFIEENVPADAHVIGLAWEKSNKDGSRDKRFAQNRQIPIALYGELVMRSKSGLFEEYQFSDYQRAETFAKNLERHAATIRAGSAPGALAKPADADGDVEAPEVVPVKVEPVRGLWADWSAVVIIGCALTFAGSWTATHQKEIAAAFEPKPAAVVPAAPAEAASKPHKAKVRRHRQRHADSTVLSAAPTSATRTENDAPTDKAAATGPEVVVADKQSADIPF